jgi:flagellar biogenesis protein FliO
LIRVLLSLAIVLGLALVSIRWVLPRLVGMVPGRGAAPRLKLLDALPLDRQHRVALVRVGSREYLLGLGAGHVTAIDSWPAAEATESAAAASTGTTADRAASPAETNSGAAPAGDTTRALRDDDHVTTAPGGRAAAREAFADLLEARR